jgi:hypothetical protein
VEDCGDAAGYLRAENVWNKYLRAKGNFLKYNSSCCRRHLFSVLMAEPVREMLLLFQQKIPITKRKIQENILIELILC